VTLAARSVAVCHSIGVNAEAAVALRALAPTFRANYQLLLSVAANHVRRVQNARCAMNSTEGANSVKPATKSNKVAERTRFAAERGYYRSAKRNS